MLPTIKEISDRAGVSRAVVSSVLNGGTANIRYSDDTRRKVLSVANELDFKFRRCDRVGVVNSVGATDPRTEDWVGPVSPMLSGIYHEWGLHETLVSAFAFSSHEADHIFSKRDLPAILKRKHVDGLILTGTHCDPIYEIADGMLLPYVTMNVRDADRRSADAVSFDEPHTGRLATEHLLAHSHRRVLYITVDWPGEHYSVSQRRLGYEATMRDAGLEPRVMNYARGQNQANMHRLREVLAGPDHPTAIFAYNNVVAQRVKRTLFDLRMSHEDVSLIAVGWQGDATFERIGITAVGLPAQDMGREAARMLRRKLDRKEPCPSLSLRGDLMNDTLSVRPCAGDRPCRAAAGEE